LSITFLSRGGRRNEAQVTQLIERAAAGDQAAWNALVAEFSGLVSAIARGHRLRDADAADVAQATWLRLLEHLGDLHDPAHVGAWLATTARRECLRVMRESHRQVPAGDEMPEPEASDVAPDHGLLRAERARAVRGAFARLRASDQALLRLLVAEPRPDYAQISAVLGMPIGSIGPTRARVLERLRRELDRQGSIELMAA
jgi:RNA polymerase sigma factor (sigma-70 family)